MSAKSALIIGATGACGRWAFREFLGSGDFTRVAEYGRRVTTKADLPPFSPSDKLTQKSVDFEKIEHEGLGDGRFDVVVITLGTTRADAGSMEKFVKIDREYVLATAAAARVEGLHQRLLYVSAFGADSNSMMPYAKSKGLTEEGLAKLGYDDTIILRPGFLKNRGGPTRILETVAGFGMSLLAHFSPSVEVETASVGKSLLIAANKGSAGLPPAAATFKAGGTGDVPEYTVISNKGQVALGKLDV